MIRFTNIRFKTTGDSLWSPEGPRFVKMTGLLLRVVRYDDEPLVIDSSILQDAPVTDTHSQDNQEEPTQAITQPLEEVKHDASISNNGDSDEDTFGELRVKTSVSGYEIYTDNGFINSLRLFLASLGLESDDVNYSEQGMQSESYVSCDVYGEFIKSWIAAGYAIQYE